MKERKSQFSAIIPARYGSTRLPGKPLIDFHGKTMIRRVYEIVSSVLDQVAVATDDHRIAEEVEHFGGRVIMTSTDHVNGTSRVAEAVKMLDWHPDYIINVQGDEPLLKKQSLRDLTRCLADGEPDIGTLVSEVRDYEELVRPDTVFVPRDVSGYALYFSRTVLPAMHRKPLDEWLRHGTWYKHLGLYAYKPRVLNEIIDLQPSWLEKSEQLEQNRWLENGFRIRTAQTASGSHPVDTPEDVIAVRQLLSLIPVNDQV